MGEVSSTHPDWSRERTLCFWDPGRKLLGAIRRYQYYKQKKKLIFRMLCKVAVVQHCFWSTITGADIPLNSRIEGGLLLPHPNGLVIHPQAAIGPNCLIFQQVTIGSRDGGIPTIGGHVDIGAGAKILGNIIIGDNVRIGANAVVLIDVPAGASVVGIPGKIISRGKG